MPITQQRLVDVLSLAREIIAVYEGGEREAREALEAFDAGELAGEEVIDLFRAYAVRQSAALGPLLVRLEREEMRVAATRRRNERERDWRRLREARPEACKPEPDDNAALRLAALASAEEDAIARAINELNNRTEAANGRDGD